MDYSNYYKQEAIKANKKINDYLGVTSWVSQYGLSDKPICVIEKNNVSDLHNDIINNATGTHKKGHADKTVSILKHTNNPSSIHLFCHDQTKRIDIYKYCVDNGIKIVTESTSFNSYSKENVEADKWAVENGIMLFTSSGNKGQNTHDNRAEFNNHYEVGAYALENDKLVYRTYSSTSEYVDFAGLVGRKVSFTDKDNKLRKNAPYEGTSEATPCIAGVVSMLEHRLSIEYENYTTKDLYDYILENTYDTGDSNMRDGKGIILLPLSNKDEWKYVNHHAIEMFKPSGERTYVIDMEVELRLREGYILI